MVVCNYLILQDLKIGSLTKSLTKSLTFLMLYHFYFELEMYIGMTVYTCISMIFA